MSYQNQSYYEQPPAYYVEPIPAVVIQTVGNCPACHVGKYSQDEFIFCFI